MVRVVRGTELSLVFSPANEALAQDIDPVTRKNKMVNNENKTESLLFEEFKKNAFMTPLPKPTSKSFI